MRQALACIDFADSVCFRERRGDTRNLTPWFRMLIPSIGGLPRRSAAINRCLRASVTPTCAGSAPPGLGAVSATGPNELKRAPMLRAGFRVFPSDRVLPNATFPCIATVIGEALALTIRHSLATMLASSYPVFLGMSSTIL